MGQEKSKLKNTLTGVMAVLVVLAAVFLLRAYFAGDLSSVERFRAYIAASGALAPLLLAVIQAMQVVLPVLPGFLGCIVGAGMFGAAGGFWCNYIGISAGSIAAFFLARQYGVGLVQQLIPLEKYDSWTAWLDRRRCFTAVLALAILLPLAPDDFLCYFSGLTKMAAKKFVWIILLAKPWCILAYSLVFAHLF